jgi:hypothetical protein
MEEDIISLPVAKHQGEASDDMWDQEDPGRGHAVEPPKRQHGGAVGRLCHQTPGPRYAGHEFTSWQQQVNSDTRHLQAAVSGTQPSSTSKQLHGRATDLQAAPTRPFCKA